MIINNSKQIQGLFIYSETAEYTMGDFIVLGKSLYVCTAQKPTDLESGGVKGKRPDQDRDNFEIYLGDRISTLSEYLSCVENPEGSDDKFVSAHLLSAILNNYMSGFGMDGIIQDYIEVIGGEVFCPENLAEHITYRPGEVLSELMSNPNLNNSIFRLSRSLPELEPILPQVPENIAGYSDSDKDSVVLKHYTYKNEVGSLIRVQEVIDHVNGVVLYRYASSNRSTFDIVSPWKSSFVNKRFRDEVDFVKQFYQKKIDELDTVKDGLINYYCNKVVSISKSSVVILQTTNPNGEGFIGSDNLSADSSNVIDLIISDTMVGGIRRQSSISIDLSMSFGAFPVSKYFVRPGVILEISSPTPNSIKLTTTAGLIIDVKRRSFYKR